MFKKKFFRTLAINSLCIYCLGSGSAMAETVSNEQNPTLVDLVNLGLSLSPEVLAAEADLEGSKTNVEIEEGGYWPSLSLSVGPADGVIDELGYDIALTQMLYDWGEVNSNVDIAQSKMQQKGYTLLKVRSDKALNIVEAYLDIVKARESLQIVMVYTARMIRIYELAEKRSRGNFSDDAELSRVKQAISYAQQQEELYKSNLNSAIWTYRNLLQQKPNNLPELPKISNLFDTQLNSRETIKERIENSPKYLSKKEDVSIAEYNVNKAEASKLPKLVLQAGAQRRYIGGELTNDSSLALRLNMDLNQGLSKFKRADMQKIELESTKSTLRSVSLEIERDIYFNKEKFQSLLNQEKTILEQLEQTKILTKTYQVQFSAGIRTIEELLNSERESFELTVQLSSNKIELRRLPYQAASELGILPHVLKSQTARELINEKTSN